VALNAAFSCVDPLSTDGDQATDKMVPNIPGLEENIVAEVDLAPDANSEEEANLSEVESSSSDWNSDAESVNVAAIGEVDLEDSDKEVALKPPRTRNECEDLPPVPPLPVVRIPDDQPLIQVGQVFAVVDSQVIVQSNYLQDDNQALDEGSILAFQDRSVLGAVHNDYF
jgi:hypothetical protein